MREGDVYAPVADRQLLADRQRTGADGRYGFVTVIGEEGLTTIRRVIGIAAAGLVVMRRPVCLSLRASLARISTRVRFLPEPWFSGKNVRPILGEVAVMALDSGLCCSLMSTPVCSVKWGTS